MLLKKLLQKNYPLLKSCLQQLYLNKMMIQLLHLLFVFTPAANLVMDEFSCQSAKATNSKAKAMNSKAKAMDSIANGTNSFANGTKSTAKTCIHYNMYIQGNTTITNKAMLQWVHYYDIQEYITMTMGDTLP